MKLAARVGVILAAVLLAAGGVAVAQDAHPSLPQAIGAEMTLPALLTLLGSLLVNLVAITGGIAAWIQSRQKKAAAAEASIASAPTTPSALTAQAEEIALLKQDREELKARINEMDEERRNQAAELRAVKKELESRKKLETTLTAMLSGITEIKAGIVEIRNSPSIDRLVGVMAESNDLQRQSIELQRSERRGA